MNMDLYFKPPLPKDIKDFNPVATPYKIWSEVLKQHLRLYKNNNQMYVKIPGADWMKVIDKKHYKLGNFETEIDMILLISEDKDHD